MDTADIIKIFGLTTIANIPHNILWLIIGSLGFSRCALVCKQFYHCFRRHFVVQNRSLTDEQLIKVIGLYHIDFKLFARCCGLGLTNYVLKNQHTFQNPVVAIKCLNSAAKFGRTPIVRYLLGRIPSKDLITVRNRAVILAAKNGHLETLQVLLSNTFIDPSIGENEPIIRACEFGHTPVVQLLSEQSTVNIADRNNEAFLRACDRGHTELVRWMLTNKWVDPTVKNSSGFIKACKNNHYETVSILLDDGRIDCATRDNTGLVVSCSLRDSRIAFRLLETIYVNPSARGSICVVNAVTTGNLELVQRLIYLGADPTANNNESLIIACRVGYAKIVDYLLTIAGINPGVRNNAPLMEAVARGHIEVVRLLIDPKRKGHMVDPATDNGMPLSQACVDKNFPLVQLLLTDPRVDPNHNNMAAVYSACSTGHLDMVKYLLDDYRVVINSDDYRILYNTYTSGNMDLIRLIEKIVTIPLTGTNIFIAGCESGSIEVVEYLLTKPDVNPFCEQNKALINAASDGCGEIVERILRIPGFEVCAWAEEALAGAFKDENFDMVRLLMNAGVNPNNNINNFTNMCVSGEMDIIRELAPQFLKSGHDLTNTFIECAENNLIEVVKYLLDLPRLPPDETGATNMDTITSGSQKLINPAAHHNRALYRAVKTGSLHMVELLLTYPGVNPGDKNSYIFIAAAKYGQRDIVKRLLRDPRVDPAACNNAALQRAVSSEYPDVVKLLLKCRRVSIPDNMEMASGGENYRTKKIRWLLKQPRVYKY